MNRCKNYRRRRPLFISLALLSVILFGTGLAVAQTPAPSATPNPSPSASPGARSETIERIVVTANKREENAQDVPSSVSTLDDTQMDNLHATQLTDFAPYVPGFTVNSLGTPGQATLALRGLAPLSAGSTVATYINDVPTGSSGIYQRSTAFQLDLLPDDIRQVEILRGPQGTLYGANSLGGLIKYVTLDPSLSTPEYHVGGGLSGVSGSGDLGWDTHVSADMPLVTDQLGIRVSYAQTQLPGYIDDVQSGAKDINGASQQSALVALLWKPNQYVTLHFTALGQRIASENNGNVRLDPNTLQPVFGDLKNEIFVNEPFRKKIGLLAATLDIDLGWADFTSATAYSNTTTFQQVDATLPFGQAPLLLGLTTTGISGFDLNLNLDKFSQELRLTSKPGRFLWQAGFFYTYERAADGQFVYLRQLDGSRYTGPLASLNTLTSLSIPSTYSEYAGYANATYNFTDQWSLGAGLRLSRNVQDFSQDVTQGILVPIANTPGSSAENVFDFMVNPQFHIDKDKLLYVRIASGYQPGGPNVALPGVPPQVNSSTAISYEAGIKSEFLDHRLLFNLAGFHIDLSNIQVGTVVNNVSALVNGGSATSDGLEFNLEYQPIGGLHFGVNGAYTDATLSDNAPSLNGKAGDRLPFIPLFSGAATADYFFPLVKGLNGHVGAGVRYVGKSYSEVRSSPTAYPLDSYAALDLNADISSGNWTFRVYAKNVTDERAYQNISPIMDLTGAVDHLEGVPIQPRTVGFEVDFKF